MLSRVQGIGIFDRVDACEKETRDRNQGDKKNTGKDHSPFSSCTCAAHPARPGSKCLLEQVQIGQASAGTDMWLGGIVHAAKLEVTVRRVRSTADRYCSVVDSVHSRVPAGGVGHFGLLTQDIWVTFWAYCTAVNNGDRRQLGRIALVGSLLP